MTNEKRLIAFIAALKNQDQQSTKKDIKKWRAEKEQKVGSPGDTYHMLEDYRDKHWDEYASFCGNTKAALKNLEKVSSYQGVPWYPDLWDRFTKPEVIADLGQWADKIGKDHAVGCEQPWDNDDSAYMSNSEAIVTFTSSKMPLPKLSKLLNHPNNTIRFMRKGQRCKVHIGDFRDYANQHYVSSVRANEIADDILADREAQREKEDRHKKKTGK